MAELKVKITSDVAAATEGLSAVQARAKQLEVNIAKLNSVIANTTSQQKLTSAMRALTQQQSAYNKAAQFTKDQTGQLASVTNQATFTMNNFTRVVQDAPYGIRGIANNIDPLVESFTRLRQQTGSTSAALKGMLGALTGPAGILLAVSTVTSVLVQFGDQIFNSGSKISKAERDNLAYAASIQTINDKIERLRKTLDFEAELSKLENRLKGLEGPSLNIANTQIDINRNIKEVTANNDNLNKLSNSYTNLFKEAKSYTAETKNQVKAINDLKEAERKGVKVDEAINLANKKLARRQDLENFYQYFLATGQISDDYLNALEKADQTRLQKSVQAVNEFRKIQDKNLSLENTNTLNQKKILIERQEAYKQYVDNIISEAKKISDFTKDIIDLKLNITPLDTEKEQFKLAKDFLDKYNKGLFKYLQIADIPPFKYPFKIEKPTEAEIKKAAQDYADNRLLSVLYGEVGNRLSQYKPEEKKFDIFGNLIKDSNVNVQDLLKTTSGVNELNGYIKKIDELKKKYQELGLQFKNIELTGTIINLQNQIKAAQAAIGDTADNIKEILNRVLVTFFTDTLTPAFDNFFKALEENKNAGQAFMQGLSEGIKGVIQQMIKLAAISAAISIFSGGKISFGTAFSQLSGFSGGGLGRRANGGPVSGLTPYLVGERGPELFVPAVTGSIVPNNAVGSFMGGRMSGGGSSVLRGQDILLAYARTQRSQLRVNG